MIPFGPLNRNRTIDLASYNFRYRHDANGIDRREGLEPAVRLDIRSYDDPSALEPHRCRGLRRRGEDERDCAADREGDRGREHDGVGADGARRATHRAAPARNSSKGL